MRWYRILSNDTTKGLEEAVEKAILDGFVPAGGVSVRVTAAVSTEGLGPSNTRFRYYQAVYRPAIEEL